MQELAFKKGQICDVQRETNPRKYRKDISVILISKSNILNKIIFQE